MSLELIVLRLAAAKAWIEGPVWRPTGNLWRVWVPGDLRHPEDGSRLIAEGSTPSEAFTRAWSILADEGRVPL